MGWHGCRWQIGDAEKPSRGMQIGGCREHIWEPMWFRGHTQKCKVYRGK